MISAWSIIVYSIRIFLMAYTFFIGSLSDSLLHAQQVPEPEQEETSVVQQEQEDNDQGIGDDEDEQEEPSAGPRVINDIIIEGAEHVPLDAILNRIPYQRGEVFDPTKSSMLIKNVYALRFFKRVQVFGENIGTDAMNLIVVVQEKKMVEGIVFKGNYHLPQKDIEKKISLKDIKSIDEEDLAQYVVLLKSMYAEKDYHNVEIRASLKGDEKTVSVLFDIKENHKSLVRRVFFKGNSYFTSKKLRSLIFTREEWLLGFLDRAGSYQPDAIEADKHVLENFYQSYGFLNARVVDVNVEIDDTREHINVTFYVEEGNQYTISEIKAPGNDIIDDDLLRSQLPVKVGDLYSKEKIRAAIEALRLFWGNYGYINADIEPSIQPNDDDKTVSIGFYTELGPKVYLDKINIIGNEKTHDRVIRRQLTLKEGGLLTNKDMEDSKNRVELLGYFDPRNGVSWKVRRINKNRVSLDLIVKEIKTGRIEFQMGFGGSQTDVSSPMESLSVKTGITDVNLFGRGIQLNLTGELSKEERNLLFNLTEPWLFDKPMSAGIDMFSRRSVYNEFSFLQKQELKEEITGGAFNVGFLSKSFYDALLGTKFGIEGVTYKNLPIVAANQGLDPAEAIELQSAFDKRFASGNFVWFSGQASKDTRNHPLHPSQGYQWYGQSKIAFSNGKHDAGKKGPAFGFLKVEADASWYTPIIGERDLVFCLHSHIGFIVPFHGRTVPFRELYNVGGPASVRGFTFGEIGPVLVSTSVPGKKNILGATRAFWLNAELAFPISRDFAMKGALFYDGGAGWATTDASEFSKERLRNNGFTYRHAIGFGVRLLRPTPVKIDYGIKLDPRRGESLTEIHFSAYHEF